MPRSLATGTYTAQQVENMLLAPTGSHAVRFEVLDRNGNLTPILLSDVSQSPQSKTAGGVLNCVVSFDSTKQIRKSLTLKMFPQPAMLPKVGQLWIKVYEQHLMPDGGWAEFVMGTYLWLKPQRTVTQIGETLNAETWDVVLGDRQHVTDMQGPGPGGVQLSQGILTTAAVAQVLGVIGVTDFSQIAPSTASLVDTLSFTIAQGDQSIHTYDPATFYAMDVAYYNTVLFNNWVNALGHPELDRPFTVPVNPLVTKLGSSAQTLAKILDTLHVGAGWDPGYFDLEDRWVAKAALNPVTAGTPPIIYTAEPYVPNRQGTVGQNVCLMMGAPQVVPDPTMLANRVVAVSQTVTNSSAPVAFADLNTLMPNHPLAQQNIGFYIDQQVNEATADAGTLQANANTTLLTRALAYETLTLETYLYPAHEGFELVGVRIPLDPEFAVTVSCKENAWAADLISGRTTRTLAVSF